MELAIQVAKLSQAEDRRVHPKVGVVVVNKKGEVLAKAHRGENEPREGRHAEYTALEYKLSRDELADCTIYTTLEPCTTRRHPKVPCAQRLVERKVRRVVIGMLDPNQEICGRGIRLLREAGIATDLFPHDLMAKVEEQNREFIRHQERLSEATTPLKRAIAEAGLSAFYPSRAYYREFRPEAFSIANYVASASESVAMVSINLMTGIPYDGLSCVLRTKLNGRRKEFEATISLLNPERRDLMSAVAPALGFKPEQLSRNIAETIDHLKAFRASLSPAGRKRVILTAHNSIPFGSAILLDHMSSHGRIQIETKAYGAPISESFAFEVKRSPTAKFYDTLTNGYLDLIRDAKKIS